MKEAKLLSDKKYIYPNKVRENITKIQVEIKKDENKIGNMNSKLVTIIMEAAETVGKIYGNSKQRERI